MIYKSGITPKGSFFAYSKKNDFIYKKIANKNFTWNTVINPQNNKALCTLRTNQNTKEETLFFMPQKCSWLKKILYGALNYKLDIFRNNKGVLMEKFPPINLNQEAGDKIAKDIYRQFTGNDNKEFNEEFAKLKNLTKPNSNL